MLNKLSKEANHNNDEDDQGDDEAIERKNMK